MTMRVSGPGGVVVSEPEHAASAMALVQAGLVEIAIGLDPLHQKLEIDAGQTLEGLGLFVDGKTLQ